MTFILSTIAAISSILSAIWVLTKGQTHRDFINRILAFSSGIMIAVSFLHLMPEGYSLNAQMASWSFLLTIFFLFSIENFTVMNSCSKFLENCHIHSFGFFAFFAISIHSMIDGLNISVGFSVNSTVGFNSISAVMMHKFADGITLSSLLKHAGFSDRKNIIYVTFMGLATVLGATVSSYFISFAYAYMPALFGISAGSFIYIAATEIIPYLHRERRLSSPLLLLLGYFFVFMTHFLMEHK